MLGKETDGFLARYDRRLSFAITRALLPLPVTPNAVTTASLLLSLLGAWWLATGAHAWRVSGVLLLWASAVLDGCDGELARAKNLCTPEGAAYDLWADHVAHLATFVAIPFAARRARPDADFTAPGVLLVSGVLVCAYSVWKLVLSRPEARGGGLRLFVERLASRDYVYPLLAMTVLGKLEWFLWAAAVGAHAFYAALWALSRRLTTARPIR